AVELPSYLIGCFAMDRIGRKKTCAPALLLAGEIQSLAVVLSMIGKFAVAIAFGLIYLYTCELYPTVIRSLAVGSGSMMCRVGSVVAPFCVYLVDVWVYLPQSSICVLSVGQIRASERAGYLPAKIPNLTVLLTLLLPETLGKPLPTTIEEAKSLGQDPSKKKSTPGNKDAEDGMELNQHKVKA
ncbi:hypothetical protein XENOCAPTIV_016328, partial [Xenoophorus captivus]